MRVTLFEYMVVISVSLNFPYPARVTQAKPSEWARLPSAKECFLGGARKKFVQRSLLRLSNFFWEEPRPRRGDVVEAERRRAAGRRFWPRSVTPSRGRDTRRKAPRCTQVILPVSAADVRLNRSFISTGKDSKEDSFEHTSLRGWQLRDAMRGAFGDELGCAADLAACWTIEVTSIRVEFFSWLPGRQAAEAR
jgi:hypothetical protein